METFLLILKNVLIFVCLAIPGLILVKTKLLKNEQSTTLSSLLMYIGMPFLIFSSTIGVSFTENLIKGILIVSGIGILVVFIFFFVLFLLFDYKKDSDEKNKKRNGMLKFAIIFSNNGFLGLPLASAVFGSQSEIFIYVTVLNIITNALIYTVGIFLISGDKKTISIKSVLLNPVMIAFIIGIIFNLINVKNYVPEVVNYSSYLSNLVTPLAMIIIGMKLGSVKFKSLFLTPRMYVASVFKLIIFPAVAILFAIMFKLSNEIILGLFIAFAMPTAGLAPTIADKYNGDTENGVVYTLGSTIISIVTIPVCYYLLLLII